MRKLFCVAPLAMLALSACAPAPLRGEYPQITPKQAVAAAPAESSSAQRVRWGGLILSMDNRAQETCFEVLARPLDLAARPESGDRDEGRFLACTHSYKDPGVFKPGREITVVGTITGYETRAVGEYEYRYPQVAAEDVHLWKEQPQTTYAYVADPFPYDYYYPYPYYYYPVVYVVPPQPPETPEGTTPQARAQGSLAAAKSAQSVRTNLPARSLGGLRRR